MYPHLLLISVRALDFVICVWLCWALYDFREEYFVKRLVFLPVAMAYRSLVLVLNLLLFVPIGSVTPAALYAASIADIPPIIAKLYLIGIFAGWWNGIDKH